MTYTFPFEIRQRVKIIELDVPGRIVEINLIGDNIYYKVQYFINGKCEYTNFEKDELK